MRRSPLQLALVLVFLLLPSSSSLSQDAVQEHASFLGQYPKIRGYPHIFVLETDGTLLYSKNTVELEEGRSYNEKAILGFLEEWMPTG